MSRKDDDLPASHSGKIFITSHRATVSAVKAATASAQRMYEIVEPATVDFTEATKRFLNAAKKKGEAVVRMAMIDEETSFADIDLDPTPLSENQARIALEVYFEIRARRRGFWSGVLVAAVPSLLLGVAAVIKLFRLWE